MENFQLYRTNILLGGQMAWDIIVDTQDGDLIVSDFHLSPINIKTPKYSDENLLNYRHQDNIKSYYKKHEGIFYDTNLNSKLKHDWMVLSDKNEDAKKLYNRINDINKILKDPTLTSEKVANLNKEKNALKVQIETLNEIIYEDSFEAGARNAEYQLYNKPIEILCPLWIEKLSKDDSLKFEITIYTETVDRKTNNPITKKIGSKAICVTGDDKFSQYFKQYISYLGLNDGIDDVLDINLNSKKATITGVSLESGNIVKNDISHIISNLLYRERPLMELDSMLMNLFPDNKIITRQLFNFNFCLDMNDLISSHLTNMIYGNRFKLEIHAYINDKELEMRDFYSNYREILKEDIEIKNISSFKNNDEKLESDKYNVLNYLLDYEYINHINKNKYIQNVVHWSLYDNPNYLFNLYNGFGPYNGENFYSHKYGSAPDLLNPVFNEYSNNIGWCKVVRVDNFQDWMSFFQLNDEYYYDNLKNQASDFAKSWVNNVRYGEPDLFFNWDEFKFVMFLINDEKDEKIFSKILENIGSGMIDDYVELIKDGVYYVRINSADAFMGLIVNEKTNINDVTYVGINKLLDRISSAGEDAIPIPSGDHPLIYLKEKLKLAESTPLIAINKSLFIVNAHSPSTSSTEVDYYKDDEASVEECYVLRYDGKIKPTFISQEESIKKNIKYFKTSINEVDFKNSDFDKYSATGFSPVYPSINFCAINSGRVDYKKWNSPILILMPEINVKLNSIRDDKGKLLSIKDVILNYLKGLYKYENPEYIYSFYDIESSYEYKTLTNLDEYIYDVKLILK